MRCVERYMCLAAAAALMGSVFAMTAGCGKVALKRASIIDFADRELVSLPEHEVMAFEQGLRQGVKRKSGYKKPKEEWLPAIHGPKCMWEIAEDGQVLGYSEMIELNWAVDGPWQLWPREEGDNPQSYILFVGRKMEGLGSAASAEVHLFSAKGDHQTGVRFNTGEMIDLLRVAYTTNSIHDQKIIELVTKSPVVGTKENRLYCGYIGDRLALLRIEVKGYQQANDYSTEASVRGPVPPERSAAEWVAALDSQNPFEVLEALVWLGGTHGDAESSATHASARSQAQGSLTRLTSSADAWISEGATCVLKGHMDLERRR